MRRHYILSLLILVITCLNSMVMAQNVTGNNWYFGNSAQGIRFNRTTNVPTLVNNQATPFGNGGSAVATNPINGNVAFYTDGSRVYDITNTLMPNGTGLNVNTSGNQPVAVSGVPGEPNQYYIFTNTANFTTGGIISASIVDMSLFGNAAFPTPALGDVANPKNIPVPGLTNRSEAMITIPHPNGTDTWLITHENGTNTYTVTQVGPAGAFTNTNISGLGFAFVAANFAYHPATGKIAVSPQDNNMDVVILNFDITTGLLSFDQFVLSSGLATVGNQAYFDAEWSANGQFLYLSRHGEPGIQADVLQYDLSNPITSLASVLPQPNTIFRSYGLQMAPDSTIYHLYQATPGGPFLMGQLTNTDTVAAAVVYNRTPFPGNPDFNGTQFPSFSAARNQNLLVSFTSQGTCSNAPTAFFPTVTPAADSLVWDFGDGQTSRDWSPIYTYQAGGAYNVTLTAYLNGQSETVTVPVNITQFDLQLTLVSDTTACRDEFPPPRGTSSPQQFSLDVQIQGGTPISTVWSNGDTGPTLTPDSAGYYYVVVTDATGCASYAGVNVREYGLEDQRANIWHFGQNAGIDFNPLPDNPAVAITGPVNSPEGVATISDRNGQVVFSTDGQSIYDRTGADITPASPPPAGLGGQPGSTQSVLIMPVQGDETLYYIFTTQEIHGTNTYELRYSLFDLKLNSGLGGIVEHNVLLFAPSTERLTGSANWLIAHEYGNNSFRAYQVTPAGIGSPVISSVGSDHLITSAENGQGYMKLGPQNMLAVALSTPGVSNVVEIFDFIDSTGVVTNPRVANLNSTAGQVYGIEFSPGGNKLFATLQGAPTPSRLYEFAIDSLSNPYFKQSVPHPGELGALQIGPDGQIYVAINGSSSLGMIQPQEDTTQLTPLAALQSFPLEPGTQSTLGLPNFIQNVASPMQGPALAASGFCLGSPTDFSGTGTDPNIDEFQWFFGDGAGATGQQAQHTYGSAGTYTVSLRIFNRCGLDTTLTQQITITAPPAPPTFLAAGQSPVLCVGDVTLEATPATNPNLANLTFAWSTGETTRTITINQQANYSVTITDNFGCTSDGTLLVADNRPIVNLGPDLTICQNTPIAPLNAQNPGTTYQWRINGANSGAAQTQSVDTSAPGIFQYIVDVTDPITTCTIADTVTFTINQSPVFTATGFNTTACGANDGRIELNITAPATAVFTYSVVGPSTVVEIDQPIGLYSTPATLMPGTYGVTVADQVSGCATITTANVNDNAFTVAGIPLPPLCDPIAIQVTTTPAVGALTYRVIDNATGLDAIPSTAAGASPFNTQPVVSGNYVVEVTATGCVASSPVIAVQQNTPIDIIFDIADICNGNITVTSNPVGATFDWSASPMGSINGATASATVNVNPGTWTLSVTASNGGANCPGTETLPVTIDNNVTADFTQSDACADQVTLTASPTGSFTYRWYRNGGITPIPGGQQILAGIPDNNIPYRVDIVSALTGCVYPSTEKPVQVVGNLQVTLASTFACEGSPFLITATPTAVSTPTFQWTYNGTTINGAAASTLQDTRSGLYGVTVSLSGCTDQEEMQVLLGPVTSGSLFDRAIICDDPANTDPATNQVELNPGNFISYSWYKDGVPLGITDPTYIATERGIYSVDLINPFGCPSTDQTRVDIECNPKITGPNAFRPGGANSEFFLFTFFIDDSDFQVFIFNRWGELIFESKDRNFRWNGGYNNSTGQPLPPGTYSYVVRYKSAYRPERGVQEKRGGVVLLR